MTACGGGDSDRATTLPAERSSTASQPPSSGSPKGSRSDLSPADLYAAVATVADLPTGYSVTDNGSDDPNPQPAPNDCAKRFRAATSKTLATYPGGAKPNVSLDDFAKLVQDCQSFEDVDRDGKKQTVKFSALSFPKLGEQTLAYALTLSSGDFTFVLNTALVKAGDAYITTAQGGLAGADASLVEKVSRATLARLQ